MVTRINSPRSDRRRRSLVEVRGAAERMSPSDVAPADAAPPRAPKRYSSSAIDLLHASLARCVPLRTYSLLLWLLSSLTCVAAVVALESQRTAWRPWLSPHDMRAFDFAEPASVVAWFSSSAYLLVGGLAVLIYGIRQHRMNDYRGRYTVWLWVVAVALIASVQATAPVLDVPIGLCARLLGPANESQRVVWRLLVVGLPLGVLATRLLFELRASRGASATFTAAMAVYLAQAWLAFLPGRILTTSLQTWLLTVLYLGSHVLVVLTLVQFARHVTLDALGMLPSGGRERAANRARRVRPAAAAAAADESATATTATGDHPPPTSKHRPTDPGGSPQRTARESGRDKTDAAVSDQAASREAARLITSGTDKAEVPALKAFAGVDDESDDRPLSRAERKRLKKENRQQRRAA